jgi:hypothetical protein
MKCQQCEQAAKVHITELVNGQPVESHVCEKHAADIDSLQGSAVPGTHSRLPSPAAFEAIADASAREKLAAYLLPVLCLALRDEIIEVRVLACWWLSRLGENAQSAVGALRDALQDPDERVRDVAAVALERIEGR